MKKKTLKTTEFYIPGTNINVGKPCWIHCDNKPGSCTWCGEGANDTKEGMCCHIGYVGNDQIGCNKSIGGKDKHRCGLKNR